MVVATSGNGIINYNLILSSSTSPYYVQPGSKTYFDPSLNYNRQIKALYITGYLSALSLIFDSVNFWTEIASINLNTASITYTRSFPYMPTSWMSLGLFVSSNVYYVGSNGKNLYQV
jgi:hypothetical protein